MDDQVLTDIDHLAGLQEQCPTSNSKCSVPLQSAKAWKSSKTLREKDVGIQLTIAKCPKIHGIFKERYSDFHVHEIDLDGKIVHLTSFDLPMGDNVKNGESSIALSDPALSQWINDDIMSQLQALQHADDINSKCKSVEIIVSNMDKQERTKLHRWISTFGQLTSETVDKAGDKYIVVKHRTKDKSNFVRRPANRARYTHCVLFKEGLDTSDAINFLARKLRISPNLITYAGTKDKRGKTTQRLCISNIEAKRLIDLNRATNQSKLGNFSYSPNRIALGDLKGNHFKIVLKNIQCESSSSIPLEDCIDNAVNSLKTYGFINYFGLQRFGSYNISTHMVGRTLLQMKWDEVFDLILEVKSNDTEFMVKAKNLWLEKRDALEAKKMIPEWHRSIESNLIHGLAKYYEKRDYLSVLNCIPRNVRTLYIHAFQSYIWNRLVSYRLEEFGMKPIVGDLVYADSESNSNWNEDSIDYDSIALRNLNSSSENTMSPSPQSQQRLKPKVKALTSEDVENYTIFDIVMPLDGTDVEYPSNLVDYAAKLLEDSGLSKDYLKAYKHRADTPPGAYRKMVVLPKNVSHKIITYNEADCLDKVIPSDLDILQNSDSKEEIVIAPASEKRPHNKKCLQIEFSLPSSSYATMALRELLVSDDIERDVIEDDRNTAGVPSSSNMHGDSDKEIVVPAKRSGSSDYESSADKKVKLFV